MLGINDSTTIKLLLILIMLPIALLSQYMFMAYTRNQYWVDLCRTKQIATLGMGSIASALTGLWLFDTGLSPTRFMFWMFVASLVGGEGVQLIVTGAIFKITKKLGGLLEKENSK